MSDVWEDPRFTCTFRTTVRILYLSKEEIERQFKKGTISKSDYEKYWKRSGAKHLEEVAIEDVPVEVRSWIRTWRHKGGGRYSAGYAVRCGGANQSQDPLNVFFLYSPEEV